jgi:hypothetical protein
MMDEETKSTFILGKLHLFKRMWTWTMKGLGFLLYTLIACCVYVLEVFDNNGVIVEWWGNVCLDFESLFVVYMVDI